MDLQLSREQQALVEAACAVAAGLNPVPATGGDAWLAGVVQATADRVPAPRNALDLVLAVEPLARAQAAVGMGLWVSIVASRFLGGAVDLARTQVHGLGALVRPAVGLGHHFSLLPRRAERALDLARPGATEAGPAREVRQVRVLDGLQPLRVAHVDVVGDDASAARPTGGIARWAQLAHAAVCLGVASRALDEAAGHLTSRVKLPENQPLSHYQGLRFMVADVDAAVTSARWALYRAAWLAGAADVEPDGDTESASWLAARAVKLATDTALQLAGGSGFSPDRPFARLARDAWALNSLTS